MTFEMPERTSAVYTATLRDENDDPIPAGTLTSLKLTLYDVTTGTILNSREGQNVLNANNVTIDGNGVLTWTVQPDDAPIVNSSRIGEAHEALWEYQFGGKTGRHLTRIYVRNFQKVG